ncbi:MAG: hypothetical protein ACJAT2_002066 [Bacteriovoracaceae bacterium]|jgi:hypothetical protein
MTSKKKPFKELVNRLKEIRKERISQSMIDELNTVLEPEVEIAPEETNPSYSNTYKKIAKIPDYLPKNKEGDQASL